MGEKPTIPFDVFGRELTRVTLERPIPLHKRPVPVRDAHVHSKVVDRQCPPAEIKPHHIPGITGTPGNSVFSDTPIDVMKFGRDKGQVPGGFDEPVQHPMYTTTSGDLGRSPYPECFPIWFNPRNKTFTKKSMVGGMYQDTHFTTELDDPPLLG